MSKIILEVEKNQSIMEPYWRNSAVRELRTKIIWKILISIFILIGIMAVFYNLQPFENEIHILVINTDSKKLQTTSEKFVSVALDTKVLSQDFIGFDMRNQDLRYLMKQIGGGYLRVGGTLADRLLFDAEVNDDEFEKVKFITVNDDCIDNYSRCDLYTTPNFTLTGEDWSDLNELAKETNFTIIFDLNVMLRYTNGSWNPENAYDLIQYSNDRGYDLLWELGNEPTSFKHLFNLDITASQLGKDFLMLRDVLKKFNRYEDALIVGPDLGIPKTRNLRYMNQFLTENQCDIDAITWHHYYFHGSEAILHYYTNPDVFDVLPMDILLYKNLYCDRPLWLGETADASGGGSETFSDKYVSTFIWLDKLGIAARYDIQVVVRQSLFRGHYALIGSDYQPTTNYWITYLYKKLVGNRVVNCNLIGPRDVRLYCHCTPQSQENVSSSVTVFGFNLKSTTSIIRIQESASNDTQPQYDIEEYIVHSFISLMSRDVYVNGHLMQFEHGKFTKLVPLLRKSNTLKLPPYTMGFWVISRDALHICKETPKN